MNIDFDFIVRLFPDVFSYLPITLKIVLYALLVSFPVGVIMALINVKKIKGLSQIVRVYISLIRGTPLILHIYVIYTIGPFFIEKVFKTLHFKKSVYDVDNIVYAIIALSLTTTVSISEAIRAGLLSVDKGQEEAGYSVGLSKLQTFLRIVFPQALVAAFPVIGNTIVELIKGTSLSFLVSVTEITGRAKIVGGVELRYFEAYLTIFFVYIILIGTVELIIKALEKRTGRYRYGGQYAKS